MSKRTWRPDPNIDVLLLIICSDRRIAALDTSEPSRLYGGGISAYVTLVGEAFEVWTLAGLPDRPSHYLGRADVLEVECPIHSNGHPLAAARVSLAADQLQLNGPMVSRPARVSMSALVPPARRVGS